MVLEHLLEWIYQRLEVRSTIGLILLTWLWLALVLLIEHHGCKLVARVCSTVKELLVILLLGWLLLEVLLVSLLSVVLREDTWWVEGLQRIQVLVWHEMAAGVHLADLRVLRLLLLRLLVR